MNYKSMIAPTKYFQGCGILEDFPQLTSHLGKKFAFLVDNMVFEIVESKIKKAFSNCDAEYMFIFHDGESTLDEAIRISLIAKQNNCDVIVGIGGGKVIDSAKLAAMQVDGIKTVIVPTSAASDAPCTANTVIYNEKGTFLRAEKPKENPSVVIVDTEIIANAPVRLFVSGMGDSFVTYYEARANKIANLTNLSGGRCTQAGFAIAKLCREVLLQYGEKAKIDVQNKRWSEEVDLVTEANIFLSGVGFENNGCSIAHATYNGLTAVMQPFPVMHGEGVAFGLLVQLATEYSESKNWNQAEWDEVVDFYKKVGLPTKFKDIKIEEPNDELLWDIAVAICDGANAHRVPFEVTHKKIRDALILIRNMENEL